MPPPTELPGLDAVDWRALHGAYGASVGDHDVAAALRVLATDFDEDGDTRQDAYDCVLWSHGWHQGTIYQVTAAIVPFLVTLIEQGADVGGELAAGLAEIASSAARTDGAIGRDVDAALTAARDTILAWRDVRAECVLAVAVFVPGVRELWLAQLERRASLADEDYIALAAIAEIPEWARDRALAAAADGSDAAAVALVRHVPDSELIAEAFRPTTKNRFRELATSLGVTIAPPVRSKMPVNTTRKGTVVFASAALVLVRIGDRNVTARAPNTGLARGAG